MTNEDALGSLGVLGVHDASERVYRYVLRNPGSQQPSICDGVGITPDELADLLAPLIERRLVRVTSEGVRPEPPDVAIGRLVNSELKRLARTEERLVAAQNEIALYASEHAVGQRSGTEPVPLDRVPVAELGDVMRVLIANVRTEMLFFRPDQWYLPTGAAADEAVVQAIREGASSRAIYPARIMDEWPESVLARARAGEQIRVVPELPSRLAVFGSETAIVPESWGGESGGRLVIRQPGIVSACVALFEQMWIHAVTVPGLGERDFDTDVRRQLLELLAAGVKDEQISRALGLSLRTVRRRIADLMAELGVDSRFQAGMEAVRRGWL
ncbi:MAG: LuxR C-terminal-related transcriptional regulator [Nocardioidaceae bacterium]